MGPYKLCAFADEASPQLSDQIRALCENDLEGLEIRTISDKNIVDMRVEELRVIHRQLQDAGLYIWSIGSPIGKIDITADFPTHLDQFKHILELAVSVQACCIPLFSFYLPKGQAPAQYKDIVFERLQTFCDAAKGYPVKLCHENEKGIFGDTADRCLQIHQALPALRLVFDPANFVQCGQDTIQAYTMLAPFVEYMHIKDALSDGTVVPAGQGAGNIPYLLDHYKQGVLTLEPHLNHFTGLQQLERPDLHSKLKNCYASSREAFDAAVAALKLLIGR